MSTPPSIALNRCLLACLLVAGVVATAGCGGGPTPSTNAPPQPDQDGIFHVRPSDDIQRVLDAAAADEKHKHVRIHAGTYRPATHGQAFVRFNAKHDGITLEGVGEVVLTAANEEVADKTDVAFPAIVNHVVYFGDGVSKTTTLRNVTITGANGYVSDDTTTPSIERDSQLPELKKALFFYRDGGAIKIFGRSYPTIERVIVRDNFVSLCGAGVSVEHRWFSAHQVTFRDCVFRNNRCPGTGAAVDVLGGSSALIDNCLFVNNIANTGMDQIAADFGLRYNPEHGCGALTVFPESKVTVERCTFTGNWNGADDKGPGNKYVDSIFWHNTKSDGSRPGGAYELDIDRARNVKGCYIAGNIADLKKTIDASTNVFNPPDPKFNDAYEPQASEYDGVGYRSPASVDTRENEQASTR